MNCCARGMFALHATLLCGMLLFSRRYESKGPLSRSFFLFLSVAQGLGDNVTALSSVDGVTLPFAL